MKADNWVNLRICQAMEHADLTATTDETSVIEWCAGVGGCYCFYCCCCDHVGASIAQISTK